jgi:hypothetical protein
MTDRGNEELNSSLRPLQSLPFDPESTTRADPEKVWKTREAEQAHTFRTVAFWSALIFCGFVAVLWLYIMAEFWPTDKMEMSSVLFMCAKMSLITVVLLSMIISLLRFAIRCAHHDNKPETDSSPSSNAWAEIVKELIKAVKSSAGT